MSDVRTPDVRSLPGPGRPTVTEKPPMWRRRGVRRSVSGVMAATLVVYVAVGWYVSGEIIDGLVSEPWVIEYDTDVLDVSDARIEIGLSDEETIEADRDAVMGLRWDGGYAQVGPATSWTEATEVRPFRLISGTPPPVGENVADFDSFAFPPDPDVLGLGVETVTYGSDIGEFEAWLRPGESATWIVAVHGLGSDRTEFLRLLDAFAEQENPILVARYRNDPESPGTSGSLVLLGQDEWADAAGAVEYAKAHGATEVVMYGASAGGAIALGYALEDPDPALAALILESPAADLRETVAIRSGEALPIGGPIGDSLLAVGRMITSIRTGVDFDTVDYIDRAEGLDTPILLFHGTDDSKIPFEVGEALADARPDLVEFHPLSGAEHVRAWNEDPEGYATILVEFLGRIAD